MINTNTSDVTDEIHKQYNVNFTIVWAERLPETCRVVIPIKLEFGASVGFIHKV